MIAYKVVRVVAAAEVGELERVSMFASRDATTAYTAGKVTLPQQNKPPLAAFRTLAAAVAFAKNYWISMEVWRCYIIPSKVKADSLPCVWNGIVKAPEGTVLCDAIQLTKLLGDNKVIQNYIVGEQ